MDRLAGSSTPAFASSPCPPVPLLDIERQYHPLREKILAAVTRVCDSGRYVLGPDCEELERGVAQLTGARHAIACASGSDALLLALVALGVDRGDEVICPSYTFFATASSVWRLGAEPVFVDIEPATFNLDPEKIEPLISPRTKAIMPVHLFGQCAAMDEIGGVAAEHGLPIIEDACQSIGAAYAGRAAGTLGDVGCFSFYPTKNLGGMAMAACSLPTATISPQSCGCCACMAWSRGIIIRWSASTAGSIRCRRRCSTSSCHIWTVGLASGKTMRSVITRCSLSAGWRKF